MDEDQVIEWEDAIPSGDGTNVDDYLKLLANTLTGGAYDFGEFLYAGNPVNYLTGSRWKKNQNGEYLFSSCYNIKNKSLVV